MKDCLAAWGCVAVATLALSPLAAEALAGATSEIDNGFTARKLVTLPSPSVAEARIVDQAVADSAFGGSDTGFPDVFRVLRVKPRTIVIEVVKTEQAALDFGVVAVSPEIELDGEPTALAVAAATGLGHDESMPALWVGFSGDDTGGVCLIDPADFSVVRTYATGGAVRDLLLIDTPHNGTDAPAADASLPDLVVAIGGAERDEVVFLHADSGERLHAIAAPPGKVTAMAAAPLTDKSNALGVDASYPWLVIATDAGGASSFQFVCTNPESRSGGPLAAPPGVVTGICFTDSPFSGLSPQRPDIFVSYANEAGDNLLRVYDSFSNNHIGVEYPARTPAGELVGLSILDTAHSLGIGDPGHGAIFYAINPR